MKAPSSLAAHALSAVEYRDSDVLGLLGCLGKCETYGA